MDLTSESYLRERVENFDGKVTAMESLKQGLYDAIQQLDELKLDTHSIPEEPQTDKPESQEQENEGTQEATCVQECDEQRDDNSGEEDSEVQIKLNLEETFESKTPVPNESCLDSFQESPTTLNIEVNEEAQSVEDVATMEESAPSETFT